MQIVKMCNTNIETKTNNNTRQQNESDSVRLDSALVIRLLARTWRVPKWTVGTAQMNNNFLFVHVRHGINAHIVYSVFVIAV